MEHDRPERQSAAPDANGYDLGSMDGAMTLLYCRLAKNTNAGKIADKLQPKIQVVQRLRASPKQPVFVNQPQLPRRDEMQDL